LLITTKTPYVEYYFLNKTRKIYQAKQNQSEQHQSNALPMNNYQDCFTHKFTETKHMIFPRVARRKPSATFVQLFVFNEQVGTWFAFQPFA